MGASQDSGDQEPRDGAQTSEPESGRQEHGYIAHKDGGGVQSDRTAREEEQWRQLTMSPEDEANVAQTHHGAEADKGIKADDAEPEQGGEHQVDEAEGDQRIG